MSTANLPYRSDIRLHQGASFSRKIVWTVKGTGLPAVDLNDFNGRMIIKPMPGNKGLTLVLTNANGGLVLDPVEGSITMNLTALQTNAMVTSPHQLKYAAYDLMLLPKVGTDPVYAITLGDIYVTAGVLA